MCISASQGVAHGPALAASLYRCICQRPLAFSTADVIPRLLPLSHSLAISGSPQQQHLRSDGLLLSFFLLTVEGLRGSRRGDSQPCRLSSTSRRCGLGSPNFAPPNESYSSVRPHCTRLPCSLHSLLPWSPCPPQQGAGPDPAPPAPRATSSHVHPTQPAIRSMADSSSSSSSRPSWNPLPPALTPAVIGSAQDNSQLLVRLLTTFNRRSAKYPTRRAFRDALDDWMTSSVERADGLATSLTRSCSTSASCTIDLAQWPLDTVLAYHTRWTAGVHKGTINMFAQDAHLNLACLHAAGMLLAPPPPTGKGTPASATSTADGSDDDVAEAALDSLDSENEDL